MTQDKVQWRDCSLITGICCDVFNDLLPYTCMHGKMYIPVVYLFYTIKIQMVYKKSCLDFWSMKNEKQVWWRDLTWIWRQLCVSSNTLWPMCTGVSHYCHVINRSEVEVLPTNSPIDIFLIIYSRLIPSINSFLTS